MCRLSTRRSRSRTTPVRCFRTRRRPCRRRPSSPPPTRPDRSARGRRCQCRRLASRWLVAGPRQGRAEALLRTGRRLAGRSSGAAGDRGAGRRSAPRRARAGAVRAARRARVGKWGRHDRGRCGSSGRRGRSGHRRHSRPRAARAVAVCRLKGRRTRVAARPDRDAGLTSVASYGSKSSSVQRVTKLQRGSARCPRCRVAVSGTGRSPSADRIGSAVRLTEAMMSRTAAPAEAQQQQQQATVEAQATGTKPRGAMNRMAVWGLVLAILTLGGIGSVLGIVLGSKARTRIRQTGERGAGVAVAAVVVGVITLLVAIAYWIVIARHFGGSGGGGTGGGGGGGGGGAY